MEILSVFWIIKEKIFHHVMQKEFAVYFLPPTPTAQSTAPSPPSPTSGANSASETSTPCVGFEPTDLVV